MERLHCRPAFMLYAFVLAATAPPIASAHHSVSRYDNRQVVVVAGVVTRYEWTNPHVYIFVKQKTDAGDEVEWAVEGFPPAMLRSLGWTRDTLRPGDAVTVTGAPARNPERRDLYPSEIKQGDRTLFAFRNAIGLSTPSATGAAEGLDGVWRSGIAGIAQTASAPASMLTPRGTEALERYDERTSPTSHCIPLPPPWWMLTPELKRLTTEGDVIRIESELGIERAVHLATASHDGALPSIQGHSIGKWEGDTLVIDTTHFAYHGTGNGGGNGVGRGVPSGTGKHLKEWLTPNDGSSLAYRYELTDPEFLAAPRTGEGRLVYSPDAIFEVEACDLESARRFMDD